MSSKSISSALTAAPCITRLPSQQPKYLEDAKSCYLQAAEALVQGQLTVVLDLDGTLISSFTPRRAPRLPPGVTSYVVGRGGRLNPQGVFVVERPGLQEFLSKVSSFAGKLQTRSLC